MISTERPLKSALKRSLSKRASISKPSLDAAGDESAAVAGEAEFAHNTLNNTQDDLPTTSSALYHGDRPPATSHTTLSPPSDDDGRALLRFLAEQDGGFWTLSDRVKQSMVSCKEVAAFLKKRSQLEEDYSRSLAKITQQFLEALDKGDGKSGTFLDSARRMVSAHESIASNRQKFSSMVNDVADELITMHKSTERVRKQLKESAEKHERIVQLAEQAFDKAKQKQETAMETWDRANMLRDASKAPGGGETTAPSGTTLHRSGSFSMFKKTDKPEKVISIIAKEEEGARFKAAAANQSYRSQLVSATTVRSEYYSTHLPQLLQSLKEANDECDAALQYHLSKYAYHYEHAMMSDATTISPLNLNEVGLRRMVEQIDNKQDLCDYVSSRAAQAHIAFSLPQYALPPPPATFGVDLAAHLEQMNADVPPIVHTCAAIIEQFGMDTPGLYRNSSSVGQLMRLKTAVDRAMVPPDQVTHNGLADISPYVPTLRSEETLADMGNLAGLMKLYFRTLPDPLFTQTMYNEFIAAARIDDERMRLLGIHDHVNKLPDPNYATLKYLIGHLDKYVSFVSVCRVRGAELNFQLGLLDRVAQSSHVNKMNAKSLAAVFGPTLLWTADNDDAHLGDMHFQCKLVEVILSNYRGIFDTEDQ
ncbi:Rho GTPase-activating protein [Sorochytrium milnesiophthora]